MGWPGQTQWELCLTQAGQIKLGSQCLLQESYIVKWFCRQKQGQRRMTKTVEGLKMKIHIGYLKTKNKKLIWLTCGTQNLGAPERCQWSQEVPPWGLWRKNRAQQVTSAEEQITTRSVKAVSNLMILVNPEQSPLAQEFPPCYWVTHLYIFLVSSQANESIHPFTQQKYSWRAVCTSQVEMNHLLPLTYINLMRSLK